MAEPLKVLFLVAAPERADGGAERRGMDEEIRAVETKIRAAEHREALENVSAWATRPDDVIEALLQHEPHIVHFSVGSADGGGGAELLLQGDAGETRRVTRSALARVFATLRDPGHNAVRVVLVNASHSAAIAAALAEHVDFAIGMRGQLTDQAATLLSAAFYRAIGFGRSVANAFDQALAELELHGIDIGSVDPVLEARAGADAGKAFLLVTSELSLPFADELAPGGVFDGDLFKLLSWRYQLVPRLYGRDRELAELLAWAQAPASRPRLRWLTGPGGAGKTRLGAELCRALQAQGWAAGFADVTRPFALPRSVPGACILLDYPEEHRDATLAWLRRLAGERPAFPVRVVLLSRRPFDEWVDDLQRVHAWDLCDVRWVGGLRALGEGDTAALVEQAAARFANLSNISVSSHPSADLARVRAWLARDPATHGLPLFATAAAIHAVLAPGDAFDLLGGDVVEALVKREMARLDSIGKAAGLGDRGASRLCGLAALAGALDPATLRRLANPALEFGLPAPHAVVEAVARLPQWAAGALRAPTPDIVAATMLQAALDRVPDPGLVPEWLWRVLEGSGPDVLDRLGRVCLDIEIVRARSGRSRGAPLLSDHLAGMVSGHISRARAFGIVSEQRALPYGLLPLAIAVGTQLVAYARDTATSDRERSPPALAKHLNNLAGHLANFGRYDEALVAIREAVNVYRHLAEEPRPLLSSVCRHLPQQSVAAVGGQWRADLAGSLHNLSLCLSNVGRYEEAREAGLEALGYYRQLTGAIAVRFTRNLINVLRILAMIHDALGNHDAASAVRAEADAIEAGHPPTLK